MLHKEDLCFQCQEEGYIAQNCPHIRCYECDKYGHIVMSSPHKIPPLGTPATHHKPYQSHHTRLSLTHHCDDRDRQIQSRSQSHFKDITAQAIAIHKEAALDHNTKIDAAITEPAYDNLTPSIEDTATDLAMTHPTNHITDHLNIEALQAIDPNIIVGHTHDQPTGLQGMNHIDQAHNPAGQGSNHTQRRT